MAKRYAIRSAAGMYLQHPCGLWTDNPDEALSGTQGAMNDIAVDAFDDGRECDWNLVETEVR